MVEEMRPTPSERPYHHVLPCHHVLLVTVVPLRCIFADHACAPLKRIASAAEAWLVSGRARGCTFLQW